MLAQLHPLSALALASNAMNRSRAYLCRAAIFLIAVPVVVFLAWITIDFQRMKSSKRAKSYCIGNLVGLRLLKNTVGEELGLTNGSQISVDLLIQRGTDLRQAMPSCPNGGKYSLMPLGTNPRCDYSNVCSRIVWQGWRFEYREVRTIHEW